ncbi:MCP four helix bundle domain-containing protein [Clostridium vincentii]|uniref:Four helix bundle sensory module for signal transduction n=1 Tax=Clostridium vincentii TaxID=52704 RepID=A0A2T0BL24_9CLOT|nr:MCP four helix bundle domain-containing protein [Clostridium vincentii]PRR84482.1 Four helix bundle sensory module for signal transduction [Clostridium vincentii]
MKWFNNLKMIQKLVSAFVLVTLFIGIVGAIGIYNMKNMNTNINSMYNVDLVAVNTINNIKANLLGIAYDSLLILNPENKSDLQKYKDDIASLTTKDDEDIVVYKTTINTEADRQLFAQFEKILEVYRTNREELTKQVDEGNYDKAKELAPAVTKARVDMFTLLDKEIILNMDMAKNNYDNSQSSYNKANMKIIEISALGLIVAVILGLVISLSISRQIKKVVTVAEALGENDLTKTINIDTKDEIEV